MTNDSLAHRNVDLEEKYENTHGFACVRFYLHKIKPVATFRLHPNVSTVRFDHYQAHGKMRQTS